MEQSAPRESFDRFPELRQPGHAGTHVLQFYESDEFLARTVAEFLADGFEADQSAIVIATPEHRDLIAEWLGDHGADVPRLRAEGQLTMLDAREMLDSFLVNGSPDPARFERVV